MRIKPNNKLTPYLLLVPMIVIMGTLVFYPIVVTFGYSLKKWQLTMPDDIHFVGLENYIEILKSESFTYSLTNTIVLLILIVLITTVAGILISLLLHVDSKISGVLLAAAIIPWALPPYVNGLLWKFIFYPGYGFLNKLCISMHLTGEPIEWLVTRWTLLLCVSIVVAWRCVPFTALVCLSGRSAVPKELYEAALIDGGSRFTIFRKITMPLMMPFIGISVTQTSIAAMNVFDEILALSGQSTVGKNLSVEAYLTTFSFLDFGKGSATTYLIMLFSAILGVFYLKSMNKEVEY